MNNFFYRLGLILISGVGIVLFFAIPGSWNLVVVFIFKGYNAVLVSIGTCFAIIILTFAIISGWNKKTISAGKN